MITGNYLLHDSIYILHNSYLKLYLQDFFDAVNTLMIFFVRNCYMQISEHIKTST